MVGVTLCEFDVLLYLLLCSSVAVSVALRRLLLLAVRLGAVVDDVLAMMVVACIAVAAST